MLSSIRGVRETHQKVATHAQHSCRGQNTWCSSVWEMGRDSPSDRAGRGSPCTACTAAVQRQGLCAALQSRYGWKAVVHMMWITDLSSPSAGAVCTRQGVAPNMSMTQSAMCRIPASNWTRKTKEAPLSMISERTELSDWREQGCEHSPAMA